MRAGSAVAQTIPSHTYSAICLPCALWALAPRSPYVASCVMRPGGVAGRWRWRLTAGSRRKAGPVSCPGIGRVPAPTGTGSERWARAGRAAVRRLSALTPLTGITHGKVNPGPPRAGRVRHGQMARAVRWRHGSGLVIDAQHPEAPPGGPGLDPLSAAAGLVITASEFRLSQGTRRIRCRSVTGGPSTHG